MKILYSFLICLNSLFIQGQQVSDVYDLDFLGYSNSNFSWSLAPFIAGKGGCSFFVDSLNPVNGKFPLGFRSIEMVPKSSTYYRFRTQLVRQMYIPGNYHQLEFILNTKCLNVVRGWLKIIAFDEEERYLCKDSVQISNVGEWSKTILKFPVRGARFFRVEILAMGGDDWLKASVFFIDRMQILGDGKEIDWSMSVPVLEDSDFEYTGLWPEGVLSHIANKRIIALAETVHGDSVIAEAERELVSILVRQKECKLLLLELPYDYALLINLYIQGNVGMTEKELLQYSKKMQFRSDFNIAFLNELKEYNRLHAEKVNIVGIDRMTWDTCYLSRFVECASTRELTQEFSLMMKLLANGQILEVMKDFNNNDRLTKGWEPKNIYWFSRALKQLSQQSELRKIAVGVAKGKERIMRDNIIESVDFLLPENKKALIIGHWLHLNKVNNIAPVMEESCGSYLNRKFGDHYWVIGILKGKGQILGRIPQGKKVVVHELELPHGAEFLENWCNKKIESLCVGRCLAEDQIGWIRLSGSYASRSLCLPIALKKRMDCFLWVK